MIELFFSILICQNFASYEYTHYQKLLPCGRVVLHVITPSALLHVDLIDTINGAYKSALYALKKVMTYKIKYTYR